MATGADAHQDQPVDPGLRGLARMALVDHVVQHQAAVAVHCLDHRLRIADGGDYHRHAMAYAQFKVAG
ncbi:hypothetical protein D3C79_878670 [compost metagenome]